MATTINSGYANSPKLTANIADHADVYGGRALVFDGVTDALNIERDFVGAFSISFWVKPHDVTDSGTGIFGISPQDSNYIRQFSQALAIRINSAGSTYSTGNVLANNVWTFLVITRDDSNVLKWYVDGEYIGSSATQSGTFQTDYIGRSASAYFDGAMCDVKYYDVALSESEVQSQYKKPESVPNQDNLLAWYPMIEGNPESPQSIVYDHSEKKLGSELVTNGTFDSNIDNWSEFSSGRGTASWSNGRLRVDETTGVGNYYSSQAQNFYAGKVYKLSVDVFAIQGTETALKFIFGTSQVHSLNASEYKSGDTYTAYLIPTADVSSFLIGGNGLAEINELDNISVKEVLMGNHATTNFFGDELVTNGDFASDANWTKGDGWSIGSGVATSDDSAQSATSYLKSASFTALSTSKTYRLSYTVVRNAGTVDFIGMGGSDSQLSHRTASGTYSEDFVPSGANTQIWVVSVDGGFDGTVDNISLKEVGVSSSGFETAVNEPVVPQVPLMKYNQKMLFDNTDDYIDLPSPILTTIHSISFWVHTNDSSSLLMPFSEEDGHTDGVHVYLLNNQINYRVNSVIKTENYTYQNKLTHFCCTYDGSTMNIYANGVVLGSGASNSTTLSVTTAGNIGARGYAPNYFFDGIIDDFSIFNSALTQTQVQELFNDGVALDATTHSKANDHLLGYWRNDGVTTWTDRSDVQAIGFDGVDNYIDLNNDLESWFESPNKSLSIWVKNDGNADTARIFNVGYSDPNNTGFALGINNGTADKPFYFLRNASGNSLRAEFGDVLNTTDWYHFAISVDGTANEAYIYQNNVLKATVSNVGELVQATDKTAKIGAHFDIATAHHFNGQISQVAIWDKKLSSTEVSEIYALGRRTDLTTSYSTNLQGYWLLNPTHSNPDLTGADKILDRSGNGNHGTQNGGVNFLGTNDGDVIGSPDSITIREGLNQNRDGLGFYFTNPSNNVLRLNGIDEYLEIPKTDGINMSGGRPFSMSCWFKARAVGVNHVLISSGSASTSHNENSLYISSSNKLAWNNQHANADFSNSSGTTLAINTWYFGTVTFNGSTTVKIYLNDALDGTKSDCTNSAITHTDVYIGKRSNGLFFNGLIDEARIYNKELSLAEIQKNYKHQKGKHKND